MGQAIGGSLALAIGIALSPVPIIAVVLMLTTQRAKANGPAFVAGWLLGLAAVGTIVLVIAGSAGVNEPRTHATWADWLDLALGVLLLLVAVRHFRERTDPDAQASTPKWMDSIDTLSPPVAAALGAGLAGVNPKNLLLAVGGAAAIAKTGISAGEQAIAYLVFALIATISVGAPVVIYLVMGERSQRLLDRLKEWMSRNNTVIIAVLCLLIGVKLIGDAIAGLTG